MSSPNGSATAQPAFWPDDRVHIADLQPSKDATASRAYLDAQIALVWPYSSSTRQFAFLLSEPDVRPLKLSRQVKVILYNGAARAVQEAKIGIGDQIRLPLQGCQWQDSEDTVATPGKRIKWDLAYRKAIVLEVSASAPNREVYSIQYETTGTPSPRNSVLPNGIATSPNHEGHLDSPQEPATARTPVAFRTSGVHSHGATPDDPFLEDIEQEAGRRRKRTKFARPSGAWKLLDDDQHQSPAVPSSPLAPLGSNNVNEQQWSTDYDLQDATSHHDEAGTDAEEKIIELGHHTELDLVQHPAAADSIQTQRESETSIEIAQSMGPPLHARNSQRMQMQLPPEPRFDNLERAMTPRLHPLASPSLPLVSPLIERTGIETGYFPSTYESSAETKTSAAGESSAILRAVATLEEPVAAELAGDDLKSDSPQMLAQDNQFMMDLADTSDERDGNRTEANQLVSIEKETDVIDLLSEDAGEAQLDEVLQHQTSGSPLIVPRDAVQQVQLPKTNVVQDQDMAISDVIEEQVEHAPAKNEGRTIDLEEHDHDVEADKVREEKPEMSHIEKGAMVSPEELGQAALGASEHQPQLSFPLGVVDGSADVHEVDLPEHLQLLQGDFERPERVNVGTVMPPSSSRPEPRGKKEASVVVLYPDADKISFIEARVDADKETSAVAPQDQKSIPVAEQLPTPAQTQEQPKSATTEISLERIDKPVATQPEPKSPSAEHTATAGKPSTLEKGIEKAMALETTSPKSRRVSQRLRRKSESSFAIESPFFSSRKATEAADELNLVPNIVTSNTQVTRLRRSKTPEVVLEGIRASSPKGKQVAAQSGTTTSLAYYPSFDQLQDYFGQTVDVIAICAEASTQPIQAKTGPRDWHTTLRLVNPEAHEMTVTVQVFRPYKDALPSASVGDALVLRSFKAQTVRHKWQLLSTDASAWAVFRSDPDSRTLFDTVDMTGPHLEYGEGETTRVENLIKWWSQEVGAANQQRPSDEYKGADIGSSQPARDETHAEDPIVLPSVEQFSSPRRSRRRQASAEGGAASNQGQIQSTIADPAQKSVTPQPKRHQPPRRARTKTPNPQPQPKPGPSSSPHAAVPDTQSLTSTSPQRTRHRTRSTLSPVASLAGAASVSVASSVAATSPTEAHFAIPASKAGSGSRKGKKRDRVQGKSKDKDEVSLEHMAPQQQSSAEKTTTGGVQSQDGRESDVEDNASQRNIRHKRRTSTATGATSPPLIHELRDGMRYVDDPEAEATSKRVTRSQVHELRDGVRYIDN